MNAGGGATKSIRERIGEGPVAVPIIAVIVGVAGGVASVGFRHLIDLSRRAFGILDSWSSAWAVLAVVMIPALGGLSIRWLVARTPSSKLAHGALDFLEPETTDRASGGALWGRVLSCALTTFTGGSAGVEGAVGQVGSGVGAAAGRWLGMPDYRVQVLRACGLAAALGGLLQAPIAGFVFAGEIVLGGYAVRSVLPLGISAFSSAYISRQLMGARTAFAVPDFVMASPVEIALYLLVGLASGVTTVVFMGLLQHTGRVHERLNLPSWLRPALGGLVVGAVGLLWPAARGVGYSTLGSLLGGHLVFGAMAALLLAKMAATSMTIGSGGGGGMFAPSMFVGALVGGALGEGTHRIWPQMTGGPHSYAIVGMAAVLAGTTRAPLTAIVLATELTGNYLAVFPVTVAVVVSVFLSSALRDETSQVIRLARRGMNAMARRTGGALHNQRVSDLMRPTHDVVSGDTPMAEVLRCLRVCRDDILIVEDEQQARRVVGVVNLDNVKALMGQGGSVAGKARDMMIPAPLLGERDALAKPLAAFAKCHLPALPVVGEDGRIRGVVTRYDVMDVCARELLQGYLGFSPEGTPVPSDSAVELTPHLHEVSAVPVPRPFTGKTLREIELLRYWGVTCVGLRRATEKGDLAPLPLNTTEPLRAGDVMILIGDKASVDRLRQLDRASERPPV